MAEPRDDDAPEGWAVPIRPALIAAVAIPILLALLLLAAGRWYERSLRPQRIAPLHSFPAPGVETFVHDGAADPVRRPGRVPPDAALERARRDVAREGLPGWSPQP